MRKTTTIPALAATCAIVCVVGCQQPNVSPAQASEKPSSAPGRSVDETAPDDPNGSVDTVIDQPEHWLVIRKAVDVKIGTWAKGEFDAARNKIGIVTKNVAEFTLDIDGIPIDWSRLVIIGIDGINAELRPRDYSPLLFRRKGFSSWSVVEP